MPFAELPLHSLLVGVERDRTRRAFLLAGAFFVAVGIGNAVTLTYLHTWPSDVWWGVISRIFYFSAWSAVFDVGLGVVLVGGLAAIQAYLNEGLVPSLVLAAAPFYASHLVAHWGPRTGVVLQVHENMVIAPTWAGVHVVPNALLYGTLGFLIGLGFRYVQQRLSPRDRPGSSSPS